MEHILATERLVLRPLMRGDLLTTHAYVSDIENTRYMMLCPKKTTKETAEFLDWAASEWEKDAPGAYEFAILLDGRHIGGASLALDAQRREGELGWILHKDYWGKGYALEAARAVRDFALRDLKLPLLRAHCDSRNTASEKLMKKLGLRREPGEGRRQYPDERGFSGEYVYSLRPESAQDM